MKTVITEDELVNAAQRLFEWNTPTWPFFVIHGRPGDAVEVEDGYVTITRVVAKALGLTVPEAGESR